MTKILTGITKDNELYFLEINKENDNKDYFSMSGFTVKPINKQDAESQVEENLQEGEEWKMAVEADQTTMSKDEWIQYVLDTDGSLAGFDTSLFDEEVEVDGQEYIFESMSCGQHEEENLTKYFIDKTLFDALMALWKSNHLKPTTKLTAKQNALIAQAESIANSQDITALAIEAVEFINNND